VVSLEPEELGNLLAKGRDFQTKSTERPNACSLAGQFT
jgi:hypothetical protein